MKKLLTLTALIFVTGVALADEKAQANNDQQDITEQVTAMRDISAEKSQAEQSKKNAEWQHHMEFLRYIDMHDEK